MKFKIYNEEKENKEEKKDWFFKSYIDIYGDFRVDMVDKEGKRIRPLLAISREDGKGKIRIEND